MSYLALDLSAHVELPDDTCWNCGKAITEVFPRPCQDGCCEIPWCLDCAHYAGFEIR